MVFFLFVPQLFFRLFAQKRIDVSSLSLGAAAAHVRGRGTKNTIDKVVTDGHEKCFVFDINNNIENKQLYYHFIAKKIITTWHKFVVSLLLFSVVFLLLQFRAERKKRSKTNYLLTLLQCNNITATMYARRDISILSRRIDRLVYVCEIKGIHKNKINCFYWIFNKLPNQFLIVANSLCNFFFCRRKLQHSTWCPVRRETCDNYVIKCEKTGDGMAQRASERDGERMREWATVLKGNNNVNVSNKLKFISRLACNCTRLLTTHTHTSRLRN